MQIFSGQFIRIKNYCTAVAPIASWAAFTAVPATAGCIFLSSVFPPAAIATVAPTSAVSAPAAYVYPSATYINNGKFNLRARFHAHHQEPAKFLFFQAG